MARTSKTSAKPAEFPLNTKGSTLAEQTRSKANHLTKTERENHFKKASVVIYGKAPESIRKAFARRFGKPLPRPRKRTNLTQTLIDDRGV